MGLLYLIEALLYYLSDKASPGLSSDFQSHVHVLGLPSAGEVIKGPARHWDPALHKSGSAPTFVTREEVHRMFSCKDKRADCNVLLQSHRNQFWKGHQRSHILKGYE